MVIVMCGKDVFQVVRFQVYLHSNVFDELIQVHHGSLLEIVTGEKTGVGAYLGPRQQLRDLAVFRPLGPGLGRDRDERLEGGGKEKAGR